MSAKIIICGNMKGGVGKSSLTALLASYIHNQLSKKVLVIDADNKQQTLSHIRELELEDKTIDENKLFRIMGSNTKDAPEWINQVHEEYDYIFLDLPGNIGQLGVTDCYKMADLLIVPTSLSREDMHATTEFLQLILSRIVPLRKSIGYKTEIYGMLYKVRKFGKEYKEFIQYIDELPIKFFDSIVPPSDQLRRKTSTLENVDFKIKSFEMKSMLDEFNQILEKI